MTTSATILADVRRSIELLGEIDDPAATRTAAALRRWIAGEAFDSAAGLLPGWRSHVRLTACRRALASLVAIHHELDASALACWIIAGVERVAAAAGGVRPDGADGHLADLVHAGAFLSKRQWRRLVRGHRGC